MPRISKSHEPDFFDFGISDTRIEQSRDRINKLTTKAYNYILRQGLNFGSPKFLVLRKLTCLAMEILLLLSMRRPFRVVQATDNGFFPMKNYARNELLIGYFQSYRWVEQPNVAQVLKGIYLKNPSKAFLQFKELVTSQETVMVHIRLGDYKFEPGFGILSKAYYSEGLDHISRNRGFDKILLFSNEPEVALCFIPNKYKQFVVVVPEFDGSASETLEAMRLAKSYLIANSTLSWWGAYLSYQSEPLVVAPTPWFKNSTDPSELLPSKWVRLNAWT